jgi:glycosyltransferase involved in cell wall biosynthesis
MRIGLLQASCLTMNPAICGGIERVELSELEHLRRLGHRTSLYVGNLVGRAEGVKLLGNLTGSGRSRKGPYYYRLALEMLYYLQFAVREARADIHHGHYTPMLPLFSGRRAIVHFHGMGIHEPIAYRMFRRRYHRGTYVFCSQFVMDQYSKTYLDIPKNSLKVVYNGIDTERFTPPQGKKTGKLKRVIFYGGWIPVKGIFQAIETARILEKRRSDFEFVIGGSAKGHYGDFGWADPDQMEEEVRKRAAGLSRCRFPGNINYAELPDLLRTCDIGVMPSVYPDPFPLVTLEMMASGLPVAAFANGGVKEQVDDGQTGFLVEGNSPAGLARAVERLLDDETLLSRMSAAARQRTLDKFTWEQHCGRLVEIYRVMMGR